jgi:hypothetical protein
MQWIWTWAGIAFLLLDGLIHSHQEEEKES